jgi:hypothetical protein
MTVDLRHLLVYVGVLAGGALLYVSEYSSYGSWRSYSLYKNHSLTFN